VLLVYGNQAYPVDQAAQAFAQQVLGDGPRDFSFQRFDAAELLKSGGGEAVLARVEGFEEACVSVPLLTERYVVRLDHVEAVRLPDRSAQALLRSLEELRVRKLEGGAADTWVPVDEPGPGAVPLSRWIAGVTPRPAGGPLVEWAPGADRVGIATSGTGSTASAGSGTGSASSSTASAGSSTGIAGSGTGKAASGTGKAGSGTGLRLSLRAFLRQRIKTKFAFADEAEAADSGEAPTASSGAGRLHQILERLLDNPPPGLSLLLTADCTREADLSKELVERLRKVGRIDKHVTYADHAPVEWLVGQARLRNLPLATQGAEVVIQRVGNDMGRLVQELERLALLVMPGQPLSEATLLEAVHAEPQGSVFTLAERIAARDLAGALAALERFLADSPNEYPLLTAVLARHFRQLRQVHLADREGASEAELAQRLKIHPFLAKRVAAQAARFTVPELERIQRALADLDVAARLQGSVMRLLVQDFVQRCCLGGFKTRAARG
jgi:DNA polymerase-3 subunit delta